MTVANGSQQALITTDIEVLREMVRIAENRRSEELKMIERVHHYNFGIIGFCGAFLSILITANLPIIIVSTAGGSLIVSILLSFVALRPKSVKGGTLLIDEDIHAIRSGDFFLLHEYLVSEADILDRAATSIHKRANEKKALTIFSAIFLVIALCIAYILFVYAKTR